jgi:hypothetical protein
VGFCFGVACSPGLAFAVQRCHPQLPPTVATAAIPSCTPRTSNRVRRSIQTHTQHPPLGPKINALPRHHPRAPPPPQVGAGLARHFGGRAAALVGAARGSAVALVELLTGHFPGFRDHGVYKGRQVGFRV